MNTPPRNLTLPVLQHLMTAYKTWHDFLPHVPKDSRYTLGVKIDTAFVDTAELIFIASYLGTNQKLSYVQQATAKLDLVKFFLQILWEIKGLDGKKYIHLSEKLNEIGKMLGGWNRQLMKESAA